MFGCIDSFKDYLKIATTLWEPPKYRFRLIWYLGICGIKTLQSESTELNEFYYFILL